MSYVRALRAFSRRFGVKIYVPPPTMMEREPILKSMIGKHNSITKREWTALLEETKHLTISGLKDHVQFAKDRVQQDICKATHWIQYEKDDGLLWCPCPPNWKGAVEGSITNFSNVYKPKLRYIDLCLKSVGAPSGVSEGKKSWREKMRLSDDELKVLSGIKSDDQNYSQTDYDAYMKNERCLK